MKLQKLLLTCVLIIATFALSACSSNEEESSAEKHYNVGIVQIIDNGAFYDMREGFMAQMRANGYGEDVMTFHYKNAQGDSTNLNAICQEMVNSKYDFVVAIATPAAQAMVNMDSDIPVFYIAVADPLGARVITDMQKPDKNATGTTHAIPLEAIFELANKVTPEAKTFGLLYNTGEINAVTTINKTKEYLSANGMNYEEAIVTNSAEVQQAAQSLVGKIDAFFIPNDSVIQSAMDVVSEIALEAKLPSYSASTTTVMSGALATIAIDDTKLGAITAEMATEYLNGKKISEIPAIIVPASKTVFNQGTANTLGIELPEIEGVILLNKPE